MIFYKNGWYLCSEKVRYIQNGEEIIQYVMSEGHGWWVDFEEKWEHTEVIEFIPVEPTQEQIDRLEEVNQLNVKEGYSAEISNYVENGEFPEGINHPLREIELQKKITSLEQENLIIMLASAETYETMYTENTNLMLAVAEVYELMLGGVE